MNDSALSKDPSEEAKLPAIYDYGDEAGAGFEGAAKADYLTPILDIVQDMSKEVKKHLIANVKAGDIILRALGEIYDGAKGVVFIPVAREKCFMVWKPRDGGGGLVGRLEETDAIAVKLKAAKPFGKIVMADGNELVETYNMFGLIVTEGGAMRVAVPFVSTKIGNYRGLMTKAQSILVPGPGGKKVIPPLFSHRYLLKTVLREKGDQSWYTYGQIGFDGLTALDARLDPRGALYEDARAFHQQIKAGQVQVDTAGAEHEEADTGAEHSGKADDGKDIPF